MGGRGSGRSASFGLMVDKCNEMHSIDLEWLRREGLLMPGTSSTLTWSRRGEQIGAITFICRHDHARLVYRHKPPGGDWADVDERIALFETATRFGGRRQWFVCPACTRRCRILYSRGRFRCRRCLGLRYETQYEPAFARAATRALKIRERLGWKGGIDGPFPAKPKGMHWRTYERLRNEAEILEGRWADGIAAKFRLGDAAGASGDDEG